MSLPGFSILVRKYRSPLFVLCTALLLRQGRAAESPKTSPTYDRSGIDLSARDLNVKPGDEFNAYASGKWLRSTVIPADQTDAGPFDDIANRTQERLRIIFQESAGKPANT